MGNRVPDQYGDSKNLEARVQLYRYATEKRDWSRWVFDRIDVGPGARVLELGCGPGALWARNLDRIPDSWEITLSDLSPGMLGDARQNLRDSERDFSFELADAGSIPHNDETFDAVLANHMLYHVSDRSSAFREVRRILKPGGRLYAATGARDHLRELRELETKMGLRAALPEAGSPMPFESFGLETGRVQLEPWFARVRVSRLEGRLLVTDAGPVITYIQSYRRLSGEQLKELRSTIEREIRLGGGMRITTLVCMFEARKQNGEG